MRVLVGLLVALWCGAAFAQPAGVQYGPGPCPFGASACQVTATGGTTPQTLANAATNIIWAPNYGSCTWDAAHDVGACINAAIVEANTLGGRTILVPAGTYGVSTTINQPYSGVHLVGAGLGIPRDTISPGNYLAVTRLVWIGAAAGSMFTEYAGSNNTIYSGDVTGIVFDCANLANVCAHFTNVSWSTIQVGVSEPRSVGAWLDTAGGGGTEGPGTQQNDIWIYSRSTSPSNTYSPTGILLDAGAGSNWNTSYNRFHELYAWHAKGDGIVFGNSDNNVIYDLLTYENPGNNTGRPVVFASSGYTMPNGSKVNGYAFDTIIQHTGAISDVQGFTTGSTITAGGGNTGTAAVNTISLTTNGSTSLGSGVLNFASTTNVLAGMSVNCGGTSSGIMTGAPVQSVGANTVTVLAPPGAISTVATSTVCVFSYGVTINAVPGTYTITAVDATHWSITAPAGGHSQSNIAVASGAVTFTDLVLPLTGTPNANDTFTLVVPSPAVNITMAGLDKTNSIPDPMVEPGASVFLSTTQSPLAAPYGAGGNVTIHPQIGTVPTSGTYYATSIGGAGGTATGGYSAQIGGAAVNINGFGAFGTGHNTAASGGFSAVFNEGNYASGAESFVIGQSNLGDGTNAFAYGANGSTRLRYNVDCKGAVQFAVQGDSQSCVQTLKGTGNSTTAVRLTADGTAAGAANCVNIPNNTGYQLIVDVMAFDHTTVTKNEAWSLWAGLLTRGANAASTAITMATTPTPLSNGTVTGSAIAATADTTNGCLNLSFTPPTGNTDTWNIVARVRTVEVQ